MENEAETGGKPTENKNLPKNSSSHNTGSDQPGLSRRKVLLVGLATTPVIFSLFSKSAFSGNGNITCSVATSIFNGTSLHPEVDRGWVSRKYEDFQDRCE